MYVVLDVIITGGLVGALGFEVVKGEPVCDSVPGGHGREGEDELEEVGRVKGKVNESEVKDGRVIDRRESEGRVNE